MSTIKISKSVAKSMIMMIMLFCNINMFASSHREAPLISEDPLADNTDVYIFRSPEAGGDESIIFIMNFAPLQLAHGGPNYFSFGEGIRYEAHFDNDISTTGDDIIYRFTFSITNEDPTTFFNIRLGAQNQKQTYDCERSIDGGTTWTTIITNGVVPPYNIGDRSIMSGVGLGAGSYNGLMTAAITTANTGEIVFCGPVDDPFFVDLGGVFDLGDMPRQSGNPRDGVACFNVSTIAIKIPISTLQKDGLNAADADNILDPDFVIGAWASASRQQMWTLNGNGTQSFSGSWIQVSRLGMPLTNEVVIPIGSKDLWNNLTPYNEDPAMYEYFYNPELALYMDDDLFGGAVPAFSLLRIQRNSLGAFDFGNGNGGLYPLYGNPATTGTALDTAIFGNLLLAGPTKPRSVDLWPAFFTGVPNFRPYHLATGKNGDPLATGKPFIHNFLPNGGDMLRLNMAVPVTPRNHPQFSSEGLIMAAVLGLTDTMYADTTLEWIPNMDGFPNGRRLEDDVTRIELQAVSGIVLAAIGLWYDDYTGGPNPVTQDLLDVLTYTTGVENNDTTLNATFPFMQSPWEGTGKCGGDPYTYVQPDILDPTPICDTPMTWTVSNPSYSTLDIAWSGVNGADHYKVIYRKVGQMGYAQKTVFGTSTTLTGLMSATTYEVQIKTVCIQGVATATTGVKLGTTLAGCIAPDPVTLNNVTTNQIQVNWTSVPAATKYKIFYKIVGQNGYATINNIPSNLTSYTLTGLQMATNYEVWVRTVCGPGAGENSVHQFATTLGSPRLTNVFNQKWNLSYSYNGTDYFNFDVATINLDESDELTAYEVVVENGMIVINPLNQTVSQDLNFNLFPNPAKDEVKIEFSAELNSTIEIYNAQGAIVWKSTVNGSTISLDVSGFVDGLYSVVVISNDQTLVKKLVVLK